MLHHPAISTNIVCKVESRYQWKPFALVKVQVDRNHLPWRRRGAATLIRRDMFFSARCLTWEGWQEEACSAAGDCQACVNNKQGDMEGYKKLRSTQFQVLWAETVAHRILRDKSKANIKTLKSKRRFEAALLAQEPRGTTSDSIIHPTAEVDVSALLFKTLLAEKRTRYWPTSCSKLITYCHVAKLGKCGGWWDLAGKSLVQCQTQKPKQRRRGSAGVKSRHSAAGSTGPARGSNSFLFVEVWKELLSMGSSPTGVSDGA